jgi:hypothetical protein
MTVARMLPLLVALASCVPMAELPPNTPPERRLQSPLPNTPLPADRGRVAIETTGPANVARVVKTTHTMLCSVTDHYNLVDCSPNEPFVMPGTARIDPLTTVSASSEDVVEPLCVAPCVVDLPAGGHTLVLTSAGDETRRSQVVATSVPGRVTGLRHDLGRTPAHASWGWVGGNMLLAGGAVLAIAGSGVTAWGIGDTVSRNDHPGCTSECTPSGGTTTIVGISLLSVGLVSALGGYLFAMKERPISQPGATTQWVLP